MATMDHRRFVSWGKGDDGVNGVVDKVTCVFWTDVKKESQAVAVWGKIWTNKPRGYLGNERRWLECLLAGRLR